MLHEWHHDFGNQLLRRRIVPQIKRDEKKLGLSLILGGCGVTLEEMTALYSAFANDGIYNRTEYMWNEKRPSKSPLGDLGVYNFKLKLPPEVISNSLSTVVWIVRADFER